MFGRRRKKRDKETDRAAETEARPKRQGAAGAVSFDNEIEPERASDQPVKDADQYRRTGPWDSSEDAPEANRMDLGSMLLPMEQGTEIQVNVAQDKQNKQKIIGVTLVRGKTALQVQPFAAPKSSGLWDEMREELREQVTKQGGKVEDHDGTFGPGDVDDPRECVAEGRARLVDRVLVGDEPVPSGTKALRQRRGWVIAKPVARPRDVR